MTLDYIGNINAHGENIVRLYDFDRKEATRFRELLQQTLVINHNELDLAAVDFIQQRNCNLTFRISNEDSGMQSVDNKQFFCDLTLAGYQQMLVLLEPFCQKETKGYQWLYDIDNPTDFLFSPGGTW